jgi:hypothetical protein
VRWKEEGVNPVQEPTVPSLCMPNHYSGSSQGKKFYNELGNTIAMEPIVYVLNKSSKYTK